MTGLDTNVLVRYIVRDEPEQTRKATRLIESFTADRPGAVSLIVLCELVWVLHRGYGYSRRDIAMILETIMTSEELLVRPSELAWRALQRYSHSPLDYADALIGLLYEAEGADMTMTFDKTAAKSKLFKLIR